MKKSLLFVSILIAGASNSFSQTIPNPGFESWASGKCTNWGTSNALASGGVSKSTTDKKSGIAALKLLTQAGQPGIAVSSGTVTSTGISGGFAYSLRPDSLTGFVKYSIPAGATSDSAIISVILTKTTNGIKDTIGTSFDTLSIGWDLAFNPFFSIINYTSSAAPDTVQITLKSSIGAGVVGSILLVDDLKFGFLPPPPVLPCYPDPNLVTTGTSPTILPDTGTVFVKTPGATFDQTFSLYVPINFEFSPPIGAGGPGGTITVQGIMDSIHIDDVTGLPAGFSVVYSDVNQMVYGGNTGCFKVTGTLPNANDTCFNLSVVISPYGTITGPALVLGFLPSTKIEDNVTAQPLANYTIQIGTCPVPPPIVIPPIPTGIQTFDASQFDVAQNNPNPFDLSTLVNFNCPVNGKVSFVVVDVLGRQVYNTSINATAGPNTFTYTSDLASGTYFFSLSDGTNTITKKMIVSGK